MSGAGSPLVSALPPDPAARRRRLAIVATTIGFLLWLPTTSVGHTHAYTIDWALIWGLVGLSVNVLTGYAGQMSLAQAALMGSGAFTLGILATLHGVPWWLALPMAGLVSSAVTLIVGLPALRIRGLHLAIVTLSFQFLMNRVVFRQEFLTSGAAGIDIERPKWIGGQVLSNHWDFMYVIIAIVIVAWWVDRNLQRSRAGRAFYAIREDEQVASSFGISVARYKLLAFAISGFYAGVAGALFSTLTLSAGPELYDYPNSLQFLVYAVIGGLGSRLGVYWASMFPIFFQRIFQNLRIWSTVLGGVLLILTLVRYRGGLAEQGRELAHLGRALWQNRKRIGRGLLRRTATAADAPAQPAPEPEPHVVEAVVSPNDQGPARGRGELRQPTRGPLLEARDVSIRFGGVQALDGVSLEVREGEIVGLMGPNGAGKTTLFNCISGFAKPNQGRIAFKGRDVSDAPPHQRAVLGFGRTFQNIGLVKSETVIANFLIAQHAIAGYGPLEGMLNGSAVRRAEERMRQRAHETLGRLGLEDIADARVHDLPHGLLKVVELGAALVTDPELLLLDEPSSGMAPPEAERLGRTLQEVQRAFGVTVLMIEHHVPLVLSVADYVYVLNFGKLLAEGEGHEIARHPEVIAAYLGADDLDIDLDAPAEADVPA